MSSKSYSRTITTITNTPKTIALQDSAVLAEGGSVVNMLDQDAINKSLTFADSAFDRASDTTEKTLEMAGIFSSNERKNMESAMRFAESTFDRASDTTEKTLELAKIFSSNERKNMDSAMQFAESSFMQAGNLMNDALHYKASEQKLRNEAKAGERALMGEIIDRPTESEQNLLFYAGIIGGGFTLLKLFKVI
jgi:hypothetical protein